jgi:cytochrome c oxidase subunit 4
MSAHAASNTASHNEVEVHNTHHVIPVSVYLRVFTALMVLFVLTVAAALVDFHHLIGPQFGWLNIVIAMIIAVIKAVIIVLYFMHVRYSSRLTQVIAISAFLWLGILFLFTLTDYFSRPWLPDPTAWTAVDGGS